MAAKGWPRVLIGIALMSVLVWYVEPKVLLGTLAKLAPVYLFLSSSMILGSTFLGACNSYLLVDPKRQIGFATYLPLYWLSWAVGLVFPGQVGDVVTLSAIMKRRNLDVARTLGRSLVDKLISFAVMVVFATCGLLSLTKETMFSGNWIVVILIVTVLLLSYWKRTKLFFLLSRYQPRFIEFSHRLVDEMKDLVRGHPLRTGVNILLTVVKVIFVGTSYWCVFRSLGYAEINLPAVIVLAAASSLVAYLPISFNGIGTVEATGVMLFASVGIAKADILAAYIVLRVIVLVLAWMPASLWLAAGKKVDS